MQAGIEQKHTEKNEAADIGAAATVTWFPPLAIMGGAGLMTGESGNWTMVGTAHQLLRGLRSGKPRVYLSVSHPARPPPTACPAILTTLTCIRTEMSSGVPVMVAHRATDLTATQAALVTRMLVPPLTPKRDGRHPARRCGDLGDQGTAVRALLRRRRRRRDGPTIVMVTVIVAAATAVVLEPTAASYPTRLAMVAERVDGGAAAESGRSGKGKMRKEEAVESGARLGATVKDLAPMVEVIAETETGARSERDGRTGGGAAIMEGATVFEVVSMVREGGMTLEDDVVGRHKKDLRPLPESSCHPSAERWP